jgi:hypothetical protein
MITTYVGHNGKVYRVTTINRESSAFYSPWAVYAETLVWEWDTEERKTKGSILLQGEAPEGSIKTHQRVVEQIYNEGIWGE